VDEPHKMDGSAGGVCSTHLKSHDGLKLRGVLVVVALSVGSSWAPAIPHASPQAAAPAVAKSIGTVKSASGTTIVLAPESGGELTVTVQDGARLLRIEPGETDLKKAAPLQLEDLQPGDRILVRGKASDDGKSMLAVSVIAMKKADIAEKRAHEREEWQKHSVGGLVTAVDPAGGTVQIDTSVLAANKKVTVSISKSTVLRRYAPASVNFDDATPAPLAQIKVGDQLRARGTRTTDGSVMAADEVVSGSFRNIAGTIATIDASANTITVNDLATKKPVLVKMSATSQLKKLPQPVAQRIAARLKGNAGDTQARPGDSRQAVQPGSSSSAPQSGGPGSRRGEQGGATSAAGAPGDRQSGTPDLQQALARMPSATLADLQKGDAVMIVATFNPHDDGVIAIILLAGVEPILQASPSGQSVLTPWSLSTAPSSDAASQ
jgi:hypothetical protein